MNNKLDIKWYENYLLAKQFYIEYGNLNILKRYRTSNGINLGIWIGHQREAFKKNKLSQEKIKLLNDINMIWDASIDSNFIWMERYKLAREYYEKNNHFLVPGDYIINDFKLGNWVRTQRQDYKKGKLKQEQIDLLNKINMIWDAKIVNGCSFPEYIIYYVLKTIYGENKVLYRDKSLGFELDVYIPHLKIAFEYDGERWHKNKMYQDIDKNKICDINEIQLYRFREKNLPFIIDSKHCKVINIVNNSSKRKENANEISSQLKNILNINQITSISLQEIYNSYVLYSFKLIENKWNENYKLAKKYFDINKNLNIPKDFVINDVNLGYWISTQRQKYKDKLLSQEQIILLENIGMSWNLYEDKWDYAFNLAKQYYEKNNNLNISQRYETPNGFKLGLWVQHQREDYKNKNNSLFTQERIELLESIGITWQYFECKKRDWNEYFLLASQFYEENGHLLIPGLFKVEDINLGLWVIEQRKKYKKNELSQKRIKLLESIEMIWDVDEMRWKKCFELAIEYYKINNNLLVPAKYETIDGIKLGQWLQNQRRSYKKGLLSKERIDLLESIDMVWCLR